MKNVKMKNARMTKISSNNRRMLGAASIIVILLLTGCAGSGERPIEVTQYNKITVIETPSKKAEQQESSNLEGIKHTVATQRQQQDNKSKPQNSDRQWLQRAWQKRAVQVTSLSRLQLHINKISLTPQRDHQGREVGYRGTAHLWVERENVDGIKRLGKGSIISGSELELSEQIEGKREQWRELLTRKMVRHYLDHWSYAERQPETQPEIQPALQPTREKKWRRIE